MNIYQIWLNPIEPQDGLLNDFTFIYFIMKIRNTVWFLDVYVIKILRYYKLLKFFLIFK